MGSATGGTTDRRTAQHQANVEFTGMRFKHIAKEVLTDVDNVRLIDSAPLIFIHLACMGLFFVGIRPHSHRCLRGHLSPAESSRLQPVIS